MKRRTLMSMESYYREAMKLNTIENLDERREAAKAFFEKLNHADLPEKFNWVEEIFEGLHVKERGDQAALIWADLTTDAKKEP
jgi:4-hydroxybutyrate---CoA ligase (AMP-forming)